MNIPGQHASSHKSSAEAPATQRWKWVFGGFMVIALIMLTVEHREHVLGWVSWLPWLFLLACPLMHLFMHHGHNHGEHGKNSGNGDEK